MRHYTAVVHRAHEVVGGEPLAALWPEHKPLAEVLKLRATTPALTWEGTFQGNPTPAGGHVFRREWWSDRSRYAAGAWVGRVAARYQSWDLAEKDRETNDYTACVTVEVLTDYRLLVREVYRDRLTFDVVPATITSRARQWNADGLLRNVIIEDKSSGTPAYQTLKASAEGWLKPLLIAYQPMGGKVERANAASVWCGNGMVWLPQPSAAVPWLLDLEDELFAFPQGLNDDQVDALGQAIIFCEHLLSTGLAARGARSEV